MNKLDTILFDLDGTLINTNEIIINSFKATFDKHFPEVEMTREKILTFIGPTLQQTFVNYTEDEDEINEMVRTYRESYKVLEIGNFVIYPDVIEVLKDLKDKGYNLGIVTSKYKAAAWPSFTHYKMEDIFDVFVALDHVTNPKPDKEPVLKALEQFPNHKAAIMIGDNKGDILAGKNANIYSAGVSWALKGEAYLLEAKPHFMLKTMKDIYRIIDEINKREE